MVNIFNGVYTVISPSGEHRTFRIRTQPASSEFAPGSRIVSILAGSDNTDESGSWSGFGFVRDDGQVHVWKSRRGTNGEKSFFEKCAAILESVGKYGDESKFVKAGVRVEIEKRCIRCNRRLTNPNSLETGIGPECAQRGF